MTTTPTLQTLIDEWRAGAGMYPSPNAARACADVLERTLQKHPVAPIDELRAAFNRADGCHEAVGVLLAKYSPQSPNPHPPGTYLWAREEHARGRDVRRSNTKHRGALAVEDWSVFMFHHADFTATDWEVVS